MSKKTTDDVKVIEHDVDQPTTDIPEAVEAARPDKPDTVDFDVTLANGATVTLQVIKDQNDWPMKAVEAMSEMNYAVLVNSILTKVSLWKLDAAGAKVRDFETVTQRVSEALGMIRDGDQ